MRRAGWGKDGIGGGGGGESEYLLYVEKHSQKATAFFCFSSEPHVFFLLHTLNTLNTLGVCSSVQGKKDFGKGKGKI